MAAPSVSRRKPGTFRYAQAISTDTTFSARQPTNGVSSEDGGTVTVYMAGDGAAVTLNLAAGQTRKIAVTRIVPGTSTDITAWW